MENIYKEYSTNDEMKLAVDKWAKQTVLPVVLVGCAMLAIIVIDLVSRYFK